MGIAEGINMVRQFHDMKVYYCACLVFRHSVPDFRTKVFFIINYQPFAKAELSLTEWLYVQKWFWWRGHWQLLQQALMKGKNIFNIGMVCFAAFPGEKAPANILYVTGIWQDYVRQCRFMSVIFTAFCFINLAIFWPHLYIYVCLEVCPAFFAHHNELPGITDISTCLTVSQC